MKQADEHASDVIFIYQISCLGINISNIFPYVPGFSSNITIYVNFEFQVIILNFVCRLNTKNCTRNIKEKLYP